MLLCYLFVLLALDTWSIQHITHIVVHNINTVHNYNTETWLHHRDTARQYRKREENTHSNNAQKRGGGRIEANDEKVFIKEYQLNGPKNNNKKVFTFCTITMFALPYRV